MSKRIERIVAACADTMFPPNGKIPVSGTEAGLVPYVARYIAAMPWFKRVLLHLMFTFLQLSPLIVGPRRARLTRLGAAERHEVFERLYVSKLDLFYVAYMSMRAILTFGYFASPPVERHIMKAGAS